MSHFCLIEGLFILLLVSGAHGPVHTDDPSLAVRIGTEYPPFSDSDLIESTSEREGSSDWEQES